MHRVILADDHPLLLRGLQELLATADDFTVIEATTNGMRALAQIRAARPDIAVLDVSMPDIGGLDILRTIVEYQLPVKAIILTATLTGRQVNSALAMGVSGILLKEFAPELLLECMRHVAGGGTWLPEEIMAKVVRSQPENAAEKLDVLTAREREIARLVSSGLSNRAIAEILGTSDGTIGIHLHNIYRKLEIGNRTALAALHIQHEATKSD